MLREPPPPLIDRLQYTLEIDLSSRLFHPAIDIDLRTPIQLPLSTPEIDLMLKEPLLLPTPRLQSTLATDPWPKELPPLPIPKPPSTPAIDSEQVQFLI